MNDDTPLPLECLAEEKQALAALQAGNLHGLPPWMTKEEAIRQTEDSIKDIEAHIAKHGNRWIYDEC